MRAAKQAGYNCYLYFAAVSSPDISVDRVKQRTLNGGHDVPEKNIRQRYARTLDNLLEALRLSYRAYLFDNSQSMEVVAEKFPNGLIKLNRAQIPVWLQEYVLDKLVK